MRWRTSARPTWCSSPSSSRTDLGLILHLINAPAENAVSTGAFCENPARETGPEKAAGAAKGRLPAAPLQIAVTSRWFAGGSFQRAGFPPPPGKAQKSVRGRRNFLERPRIAKHPPLRASTVRRMPAARANGPARACAGGQAAQRLPRRKGRSSLIAHFRISTARAHARLSERARARLCRRTGRAKTVSTKAANSCSACPPFRASTVRCKTPAARANGPGRAYVGGQAAQRLPHRKRRSSLIAHFRISTARRMPAGANEPGRAYVGGQAAQRPPRRKRRSLCGACLLFRANAARPFVCTPMRPASCEAGRAFSMGIAIRSPRPVRRGGGEWC